MSVAKQLLALMGPHYPTELKVGDRVVIRPDSQFSCQNPMVNGEREVGTVIAVNISASAGFVTKVRWEGNSGYQNDYRLKDLEHP